MTPGLVLSIFPKGRTCPKCGGRKGYYAECCRACKVWVSPNKGRTGPAHPAWKGGQYIDCDGYVRAYAPTHPWPRRNNCLPEHVRVMELHIGRRLAANETVHHRDHNRQNNALDNLEIMLRGDHSRYHRRLDTHRRQRRNGRFI